MAVHTTSYHRLIAYSEEIIDGQPIFVSSNSLPTKASKLEPAGHSFHSAALKLLGVREASKDDAEVKKVVEDNNEKTYLPSDSYSSNSKKKKNSGSGNQQEQQEQDHYALLGLSHLRYLATEDQIRKSYRETALRFHPDKQAALLLHEKTESAKQKKKDEIETHFKAIQEAYEVLVDPVKRRIYDSTDEFDDEIPTDCSPQDFFKVFGPAFMRNGRWSVNQPIPSLGDDNTSIKEVDSFYNFWYSFKSWREFPHADEFDLEQAESRDHKRWMERQNAKLSEKARKEDYARIRTLVDNAYKRDPRILRRKEEEKKEKQRKKQAKHQAKRLQEEEAIRVAEEEKRRKEEEDKRAAEIALQQKKLKEKEKKLLRKERARLRNLSGTISSQHLLGISQDDVENICMSFDILQLRSLCEKMEGKEGLEEQAKLVRNALSGNKEDTVDDEKVENIKLQNGSVDDEKVEKIKLQNGSVKDNGNSTSLGNNIEKKEKPWSKEEIELLKKGMQKYPKGTSRRWEVISEYIGSGRSVEEIMKATKTVLLQKPDTANAFDTFLEKRKPTAQPIASPLSTREELEGLSVSASTTPEKTTNNIPEEDTTDAAAAAAAANGVLEQEDEWSEVQKKALVQALKAFPKDANQRWERVATAVPGKTLNQCKKKFASMKDSFRNNKTAV